MKKILLLPLVLLLCLNYFLSNAQQGDTIEIQRNQNHKITFARFKPNDNRKQTDGVAFLSKVLSVKTGHEFRLAKETTDELGISHQRYTQYWKGIKIDNEEYLIHGKNGTIETINGESPEIDIASVSPINEKAAMTNALTYVGAKKYKWEDAGMERWLKENTKNANATYYPKGELVIAKSNLKGSDKFLLSWKFTISSLEPNNEQLIYVDATQGNVIADISLICNINTICTSQTRYSGQQNITGDTYSGGVRLYETRNTTGGHTANISTLNIQGGNNYGNAIEFNNNTVNYTPGNWATFNQDQSALDVHWGIERVIDYWATVQQRNSINNSTNTSGLQVTSYVHYYDPNPSSGFPNNAQWDGGNHVMCFGDGDGITFNAVVALDVTAHELGHGVCQYTANLGGGEAASLNEGLSDIWGAVIEHWAAPNKQMWEIGEEVMANGAPCLRSLINTKTGGSGSLTGGYPNTYQGQFWDANNIDVHINSTVLSHWFYLLSVGGCGHIDDNANNGAYTIYGISIEEAANIVYRAESHYLTSSSNYAATRTAMINAAVDLYGGTSNEVAQVTNAWYAAGVGAAYAGSASPIVSSSNPICSTANFSIPNLPAGTTVTWSSSSPNVPINSTTGVATVLNNYSGQVSISATVNGICGAVPVPPKTVWAGGVDYDLKIDGSLLPSDHFLHISQTPSSHTLSILNYSNANVGMDVTSYLTGMSGPHTTTHYPNMGSSSEMDYSWTIAHPGQTYTFAITFSSTCGTESTGAEISSDNNIADIVVAYPNPAATELTVQVQAPHSISVDATANTETETLDVSYQVDLIDNSSQTRYSTETSKKEIKIPLDGIPNGIYYLRVRYKDAVLRKQIVIKR